MATSLNNIEAFLSAKRIALIGMSRKPQHISAQLLNAFCSHGYEMFPVNPNATEIVGHRCYGKVGEITPVPDAALLTTPPAVTAAAVQDCVDVGIRRIWLYRGGYQGCATDDAIALCREHGVEVVPGECPFMFLKPVRHIHWAHRCFTKLTGHYPLPAASL